VLARKKYSTACAGFLTRAVLGYKPIPHSPLGASYFLGDLSEPVGLTGASGLAIIGAGGAGRSLICRPGLPNASALMINCV